MKFRDHFLAYTVIPILILLSIYSYARFMIAHDYIVSYEGFCDPQLESCFVYCEDDACLDPFYYVKIERSAAELFDMCGEDITACDAANLCPKGDAGCSITLCDLERDGDVCDKISL